MPLWVTRYAGGVEVGLLVADGTTHRREAMAVRASLDWRLMKASLVALARVVAGRVAVNAAWMGQHFAELAEQCGRPLRGVRDGSKALR